MEDMTLEAILRHQNEEHAAEIARLTAALAEAEARSAALVAEARAEKAEADELPWRMLRLAAETFCARVENGEIRSKRSYAAFKDALNALPDAKGGV